jgi:hypothetical protein
MCLINYLSGRLLASALEGPMDTGEAKGRILHDLAPGEPEPR